MRTCHVRKTLNCAPHTVLLALAFSFAEAGKISFTSRGNPILSDGSHYSSDPAPIVVNETLYIIAGEDTAPIGVNDFILPNWNLFSTDCATPQAGNWTLYTDWLKAHQVFAWASQNFSYASQIVRGADDRFYLYAPVQQLHHATQDPFGIGVAVADNVLGPYKDAHPSGPIVSQSYPAPGNDIQNIDPTVLVDDDKKVYMYWGTFGRLRAVQLECDMVTFASNVTNITSLPGYFEAPWIMKRKGTYYLLYADNNVTSSGECTPTLYHACIAYGTADHPLGPWTYRGIILGIVSSTTSHPGAIEFHGQWFLIYHTADAKDGGNFRRSIAWDRLEFDDSASPPTIHPVEPTQLPKPPPEATLNQAPRANATSDPVCAIQYWIAALNDEKVNPAPLPPEYWSSYNGTTSPVNMTLTYTWKEPVTLNGTKMVFWADHGAGAVEGVAPPAAWHIEYRRENHVWAPARNQTPYPLEAQTDPPELFFDQINTTSIRALLEASTNGTSTAAVAVAEWYALAPTTI